MKVWELMAALAKVPAGVDVLVAHNAESHLTSLMSVDDTTSDEQVYLHGDGNFTVGEDHENGTKSK